MRLNHHVATGITQLLQPPRLIEDERVAVSPEHPRVRLKRFKDGGDFSPAGWSVTRHGYVADKAIAVAFAIPSPVLQRHPAQSVVFERVVDGGDVVKGNNGESEFLHRRDLLR